MRFPGPPTALCTVAAEVAVAPAKQRSNRYAMPVRESFLQRFQRGRGPTRAGPAAPTRGFCRPGRARRQELPAARVSPESVTRTKLPALRG